MEHENHIIELFVGYSILNKKNQEMKANCSVTLVKSAKKIILVILLESKELQFCESSGIFKF